MQDGARTGAGVEHLAPGLRALTAPNAGPMTFTGTRSYLVGTGVLALIDPGPDDPRHLEAIGLAAEGARIGFILVTHAHRDHSAGARAAGARFGAEVCGFGDLPRSPAMQALSRSGGIGGGEGIDAAFRPDRRLGDCERVAGPGWTLTALHTPGHLGDHLCFAWAEGCALFSGDLVMGWATTLISPPDGDLGAYRASLARLGARDEQVFHPGHGPPVTAPRELIAEHLAHRQAREAQILGALERGPARIEALVGVLYSDVDRRLWPAASRNVLAHLIDLVARGEVACADGLSVQGVFALA